VFPDGFGLDPAEVVVMSEINWQYKPRLTLVK
jgi:hypothetical protein